MDSEPGTLEGTDHGAKMKKKKKKNRRKKRKKYIYFLVLGNPHLC